MDLFSNKAETYARYRWDYAPAAVRDVMEASALPPDCTAADVGSGTGILTAHLLSYAGDVYAVEPSRQMRAQAEVRLGDVPGYICVNGKAEQTGLSSGSVDIITSGQSIHWFDPEPARDRKSTRLNSSHYS